MIIPVIYLAGVTSKAGFATCIPSGATWQINQRGDGEVNNVDFLYPFLLQFIKKRGFFLKHTCGQIEESDQKSLFNKINELKTRAGMMFRPDYVNAKIEEIKKEIFANPLLGALTFPEGHIAHWERVTGPTDFILNPFKSIKMDDKFKSKLVAEKT